MDKASKSSKNVTHKDNLCKNKGYDYGLICWLFRQTYENPFILSSGPPTASIGQIKRAFEAGWAGAVIKTLYNVKLFITVTIVSFAGFYEEETARYATD